MSNNHQKKEDMEQKSVTYIPGDTRKSVARESTSFLSFTEKLVNRRTMRSRGNEPEGLFPVIIRYFDGITHQQTHSGAMVQTFKEAGALADSIIKRTQGQLISIDLLTKKEE